MICKNSEQKISDNIYLCPDGKYRWIYELSLFRNPTVFLLVWKIFFFIVLGICIVVTIVDSGKPDFWWDGFFGNLKIFGIILGGMTALTFIGYSVYALTMGGKYIVLFELDEKGVNHKQLPAQAKKAQALAALTALAGASGGSLTTAGVGLNAARTEMYTSFDRVKKLKPYKSKRLIKVNQTLSHNQVYCEKEDFDFIFDFITKNCPNLKK